MKDSTENLGGMYHAHIVLSVCRASQEHRESLWYCWGTYVVAFFLPEECGAGKLWSGLPELPGQGRGATIGCHCAVIVLTHHLARAS